MRAGNGTRGGPRPPRTARPRVAAADLGILLAGVVVAVAAISPIVAHWLTNPPDQRMVDLEVYRDGGAALLRGAPLYEVLTQPPQFLPFTYPPFAGLLAVPFTLMPWNAAQWTWTICMYAALTITVCYAFRDLIRRAGRWAPVATGALVGATAWMWPSYDQMRFGQVGFFLMALCLADCAARSARWPRGALVGLAIAIKLVPGVFLIYFLITGRWEALRNAVLTAVVATLATFALLPSDSVDYWFGALLEGGERTGAITATTNQALNGMLARVIPEGPVRSLVWLIFLLAVAYGGFRLARRSTLAADDLALHGPGSTPALRARDLFRVPAALHRPAGSVRRIAAAGWERLAATSRPLERATAFRPSGPLKGTDLMGPADRAAGPDAYSLLLGGIAITGLLSVLLSPVGWMHHLVWMIAVLGALIGDGRDARRCLVAVAVWIGFLFPLPWYGAAMSGSDHRPITRFFGRVVQDAFGLAAVTMIMVLGIWLVNRLVAAKDRPDPSRSEPPVGTLAP
ncbi:glycosyltransferase 87 family protein [Spirillospora sp. NPDC047279]|uniref:glycosyltransferase 87 family protein n=1 Tax=Spirillospora sp. NPDC047279 TaxID=3155478 RepID=UPI0033EA1928